MTPRQFLRGEGLALFAVATAGFVWLDGPLWLYLLLALAPDLSMLGYLRGPVTGSRLYNLFHTSVVPLALVAVAGWSGVTVGVLVGLVWLAHIGVDRALGYGLKESTGFGDTHLGPIGRNRSASAIGRSTEASAASDTVRESVDPEVEPGPAD